MWTAPAIAMRMILRTLSVQASVSARADSLQRGELLHRIRQGSSRFASSESQRRQRRRYGMRCVPPEAEAFKIDLGLRISTLHQRPLCRPGSPIDQLRNK
jgi:hypothetical protein